MTSPPLTAPAHALSHQRENPLLNPMLLALEGGQEFKELRPFKHRLQETADRIVKEGRAEHVSIYFRDLWNGPWFGINEKEPFAPGSLLKVPIMLAVLRQADSDPDLLRKEIVFSKATAPFGHYERSVSKLEDGKAYTVDALLWRMIADSDNQAMTPLLGSISEDDLAATYFDLGLLIPLVKGADNKVSVKEYSSFFRILYNASYLSRKMSGKALDYLSQSTFRDGLAAGVPPGVVVARKMGESVDADKATEQVHECGIVYHPGRHYTLCVMTRGKDFETLTGILREVSKLVYAEVSAQSSGGPASTTPR